MSSPPRPRHEQASPPFLRVPPPAAESFFPFFSPSLFPTPLAAEYPSRSESALVFFPRRTFRSFFVNRYGVHLPARSRSATPSRVEGRGVRSMPPVRVWISKPVYLLGVSPFPLLPRILVCIPVLNSSVFFSPIRTRHRPGCPCRSDPSRSSTRCSCALSLLPLFVSAAVLPTMRAFSAARAGHLSRSYNDELVTFSLRFHPF